MVMMKSSILSLLTTLLLCSSSTNAIDLDIDSLESIQHATGLLATGLMDYYWGYDYGGTVGMFTNPYYWWEAGGAWGSMLDHWYYLQNDTYADVIFTAMQAQVGDDWDYIPLNQSTTEGNDDQAFWGIAAIQAAERNFTNPSSDEPQWLYLAQAVFNTMAWRWDTEHCGGGLRWQIFQYNSGYDYKNTVSNAGLFHIGARLARFTGNDSYVDWAEEIYDWLLGVNFITEGEWYFAYDGANIDDNCSSVTKLQWTYNAGMMVSGCAYLYNYTEDEIWLTRTEGYVKGISVFFNDSVLYEAACQASESCNNDQRSFKAYMSRFLGLTSVLAPTTYDTIRPWIEKSAKAAAQSCVGGYDGHTCGMNWFYNGWDGYYGLGEEMSALEIIQNLLAKDRPAPYTATNGGSSSGDGAAGSPTVIAYDQLLTLDGGDKAGAAIITIVIGVSIVAFGSWLVI
ncbi:glycoside hydrolase family 76 protein [[Candida] arabinofermentans NRRL YB-2248]|uniref:Mannan endo-1,6-alpha-mannosidase n=1 Tax=[Candida] arabinofermentans NRRL YB-2248 TaxID=983967 RepID=A0A1E4STX7_9ASCO|nr:glycoside hydrolase family 76 protein [[Candida] arabinofermentans NRRL YB-2248]